LNPQVEGGVALKLSKKDPSNISIRNSQPASQPRSSTYMIKEETL
jgi:hypothetical protein